MNGERPEHPQTDGTATPQVIKPDAASDATEKKQKTQEVAVALHDSQEPRADTVPDSSTVSQPAIDTAPESQPVVSTPDPVNEAPASPPEQPLQNSAEAQPMPPVPPAMQQPAAEPEMGSWQTSINEPAGQPSFGSFGDSMPPAPEAQWTASEFIAHEKSPMWYAGLAGVAVVLIALAQFLMHDVVAVVSIALIAVLFGAVASHKPRTLEYRISDDGIQMGRRQFMYSDFKSFGVVKEDAFSNITLIPMKRFSPPLTIYYPPEEEDTIVAALSAYLPMAPVRVDMIDSLLRRIRL